MSSGKYRYFFVSQSEILILFVQPRATPQNTVDMHKLYIHSIMRSWSFPRKTPTYDRYKVGKCIIELCLITMLHALPYKTNAMSKTPTRASTQVQLPVPFSDSVNKNPAFSRYMEQLCMMLPPPQTHMNFTRLVNYKFVCIILTNTSHFTVVHLMELFVHNA